MRYGLSPLSVGFECASRTPASWKEELSAAALDVANTAQRPIWLCSNAGITSEVMCRVFFEQGIQVHILSVITGSPASAAAAAGVRDWCRARNVEHATVEFDAKRFLESDLERYAEEYVSGDARAYFRIWLLETVEKMRGFAVFAESLQYYRADRDGAYLLFDSGTVAPLEWCKKNKAEHEPHFFERTPELSLAYAREPAVAEALRHPGQLTDPAVSHKLRAAVFHGAWSDIQSRRKTSFYEHVRPLKEAADALLKERFGEKLESFRLPAGEFLKELGGA